MINKICRVVGGILIVCLVVFGIYKIMPNQYSYIIDSKLQMLFDSEAKEIIEKYQDAKVVNNTSYTYKQVLEGAPKNPSWILETVNEAEGTYKLIYNGYKINFELEKDDGSGDLQVYTNAHLCVEFYITEGEKSVINSISVYINGDLQNDHYKQEVFDFLAQNL